MSKMKNHFLVCSHLRQAKKAWTSTGYLYPIDQVTCKACLKFTIKAAAGPEVVNEAWKRLEEIRLKDRIKIVVRDLLRAKPRLTRTQAPAKLP